MPTEHFDAIVIGAGQAGGPLAGALARAGRRTAIVERTHVGGTCINEGCTPTKTMVASARVAYLAKRAADYGVHADDVRVDLERVRQRKRDIVTSFRQGSERRLDAAGVVCICGEARFRTAKTVAVRTADGTREGERELEADLVFINVGERPVRPNVPGIDDVPVLDSTSIMELDTVPRHLLVLGGGYIGLEFGQMFRRFGSDVTVVQRAPRLLGREDPDVADAIAAIMREDGLDVLLSTEAVRVARDSSGDLALAVRGGDGSGERTITGSHLLAAAGRRPNTDSLDLPAAGIETDARGYIRVNDRLETSVPGVYALGDAKGGPAFTHISYDDFRVVRTNLLDGGSASIKDRLLPYTLFTDPQLGRVGMSETDATRSGRDVRVAKMPMSYVARALEVDEPRGFMKVVVDAKTGELLGAAVLGIEGGEMMSALSIAMMGRVPYTTLRDAVFAHPTLAESFNTLFASL